MRYLSLVGIFTVGYCGSTLVRLADYTLQAWLFFAALVIGAGLAIEGTIARTKRGDFD